MSILKRLEQQEKAEDKKLFCVVAGVRLSGKTTLSGTLPGRTLLLQAVVRESGSASAEELARLNGNQLDVLNFNSVEELLAILKDCKTDEDFDNVVVDSLSALTDMKYEEPKIKTLVKTDNWAAFREIGDVATAVILALKELTYSEKTKKPKNAFLTVALAIKQDKNGAIVDVSLEAKGNVAVTSVTKYGEAVVTVLPPLRNEQGVEGDHRLLTKSVDVWPGRIDGVLKQDNPGIIEPANLGTVLKLLEKKKGQT